MPSGYDLLFRQALSCFRRNLGMESRRCNRRRGQVLLMVTLALIPLFGILGLVTDIGYMQFVKMSAQTAAEAAAQAAIISYHETVGGSNAVCGDWRRGVQWRPLGLRLEYHDPYQLHRARLYVRPKPRIQLRQQVGHLPGRRGECASHRAGSGHCQLLGHVPRNPKSAPDVLGRSRQPVRYRGCPVNDRGNRCQRLHLCA